jgi:hypothetical protein
MLAVAATAVLPGPGEVFGRGQAAPLSRVMHLTGKAVINPRALDRIGVLTVEGRQPSLLESLWYRLAGSTNYVPPAAGGHGQPNVMPSFTAEITLSAHWALPRGLANSSYTGTGVTIRGWSVPNLRTRYHGLDGSTVVAVNGHAAHTIFAAARLANRAALGSPVSVRLDSGRVLALRRVAGVADGPLTCIGIVGETRSPRLSGAASLTVEPNDVSGPSAGLAAAIGTYLATHRDPTHGLRIAATGEVDESGIVLDVSGVAQKVAAARAAGYQVVVVPASNLRVARSRAGSMRVIGATSLADAIRQLGHVERTTT